MTNIFSDTTPTEAEINDVKSSKHYEQDIDPLEPAEPLTDSEQRQISDQYGSSDLFADLSIVEEGYKGEWIPPKVRQARRRALSLPHPGAIKTEEDRLFEIARHDGQPEELTGAIATAREACQEAYAALDNARHPEMPKRPKSAQAKQAAIEAIEAARQATNLAVAVAERDDIRAEQYENIVSGIADAQAKAAEALDVAAAEFARWRALISAGHELAQISGRFGDWHRHKDEHSINPRGLIGDLRRARDLANTQDPYLSGRYLYDDPTPEGELPEWTREALRNGVEWDRNLLWRLNVKRPEDPAATDSLVNRDLKIINGAPVPAFHPDAKAWEAAFGRIDD